MQIHCTCIVASRDKQASTPYWVFVFSRDVQTRTATGWLRWRVAVGAAAARRWRVWDEVADPGAPPALFLALWALAAGTRGCPVLKSTVCAPSRYKQRSSSGQGVVKKRLIGASGSGCGERTRPARESGPRSNSPPGGKPPKKGRWHQAAM